MTQNSSFNLSFLSKFDPNEFYEIAKDLPSSIEIPEENNDQNSVNNNNIQIIGTHLLLPQKSISRVIENCFNSNNTNDNSITFDTNPEIDFEAVSSMLNSMDNGHPISNLPSTEPFLGLYNFNINILSADTPVKKCTSWTYSSKLNKLYCNPNVACPVDISVSSEPPIGSTIRAMAVYAKFEHIEQIITRCENHKKSKEFETDADFPEAALAHFIRCRHNQAAYIFDLSTNRQSVVVPFEKPPTGSNVTTLLYQFMCYSSCIGGSQKPVKIVLTLENNGQIIGRNSFEIKICACPGRDRQSDENKLNKKKSKVKPSKEPEVIQPKPTQIDNSKTKNEIIKIKSITLPNQEDDDETFTLKVKGRKNYEILKKLNEALEIQNIYTKMKRTNSNELNAKTLQTRSSNFSLMRNGSNSSFLFSNNSNLTKNQENHPLKRKHSEPKIATLEQFLESLEMDAYFNIIVSKGIKTLEDLLESNKKKINGLKISQTDTTKLWNAIQKLKSERETVQNQDETDSPKSKKPNLNQSMNSFLDLSNCDLTENDQGDYIKLSKYQIKYSIDRSIENNKK